MGFAVYWVLECWAMCWLEFERRNKKQVRRQRRKQKKKRRRIVSGKGADLLGSLSYIGYIL